MIKSICFLIAGVLSLTVTQAQSFEGKIVYANSFKSKLPNVTDEQLTTMMGNTQEFYIKGNNYKSTINGTIMQWQLYVPADNKLYSKVSSTPVLIWNDGAENKDSVLKAEVVHNADTILGYPCDKLVLTCVSGTQEYYYNKVVAVDASLFVNHKFGNWYEIVSRTHALPLKEIVSNAQFTLTGIATSVAPMKVDASLFALPTDVQTMKSPY